MATSSVCSCFSNMQSRYKRLVNNVFPSNPSEGLVKSNMEKLTFYAIQAPEKLDRIGEHLFQKTNNYLYRKKLDYVYISMEAMDSLLFACGASSLNLFVESFLKMVTLLLESSEIGLQIRATKSFVKFANIDEDTPSYHRRYEFFISRFSQLCYTTDSDNPETEKQIRLSGLQGLQGVVRKTVNDDLQANIWDDTHMSRIVPALLFNIECNSEVLLRRSSGNDLSQQKEIGQEEDNPAVPADSCLRELVTRAGFNNIAAILDPLLQFMDNGRLWLKNEFPLHIFKIVMYSIPNQYSYRAIELLFSHLDKHKSSEADMRASIVEMISASVTIATGGSLGPSLLEVFNTLLKHLKISVDFMNTDGAEEAVESMTEMDGVVEAHPEFLVQNAIINAAGTFSSILADYQRVDVMLFIIMKIPHLNTITNNSNLSSTDNHQHSHQHNTVLMHNEKRMQRDLLRFLLQVSKSHQVKQFSSTCSPKLMDALLPGLCIDSPVVRRHVQEFWVMILDRHNNLEKLEQFSITLSIGEVTFNVEKCSRQDQMFMKKNRHSFFFHIYESLIMDSNDSSNIKLLSYFVALLLLECDEEDNDVELVSFVLGLQNHARSIENDLSWKHKACIHALCALFFLVLGEVRCLAGLVKHCEDIIAVREKQCKWMLPRHIFTEDTELIDNVSIPDHNSEFYFSKDIIVHVLKNNNFDTSAVETPYVQKWELKLSLSVQSIPDNLKMKKADSELSVNIPSIYHHRASIMEAPIPKITYEDLKDALRGENVERPNTGLDFNRMSFAELVSQNERVAKEHENKLKRLLEVAGQSTHGKQYQQEVQKNLFEIEFPKLFVYERSTKVAPYHLLSQNTTNEASEA